MAEVAGLIAWLAAIACGGPTETEITPTVPSGRVQSGGTGGTVLATNQGGATHLGTGGKGALESLEWAAREGADCQLTTDVAIPERAHCDLNLTPCDTGSNQSVCGAGDWYTTVVRTIRECGASCGTVYAATRARCVTEVVLSGVWMEFDGYELAAVQRCVSEQLLGRSFACAPELAWNRIGNSQCALD